jgi:hypothetical protein
LAAEPKRWQSITAIASAQGLPQPMLEQLLLQLRRSGLVEARRGRYGGYRLGRPAREIPVAAVLEAVAGGAGLTAPYQPPVQAEPRSQAPARDPATGRGQATARGQPAAPLEPDGEAVPEERVLAALERRLKRALERELRDLNLEELHYDLRSGQESLSNDGGLLLG